MALRVTLGDESWQWDPNTYTVKQMIALEDATGMTLPRWCVAIDERSARALAVLIWDLRGQHGNWQDIDFPITDVAIAPEKGPDPTGEAGETSETETSPSSAPPTD